MALRNMGLTVMRFLIPSMDKLQQLNTTGAKKVMAVGAAFEFLKISLFETLANTPMFQTFVEWIIKGALWIAEFTQKHPQVVAMAAAISAAAVALGTIAIGVGVIGQLEHIVKLLGIDLPKNIKSAKKSMDGFNDVLKTVAGIVLIGWSIKNNIEDITDADFDVVDNAWNAAMFGAGVKMFGASTKWL
jgi:hypothetical protein